MLKHSGVKWEEGMNRGGFSCWRFFLLRSCGFGAGFALTLNGLIGVWVWAGSRPKPEKPWDNAAAIKAA